MTIDTSDIGLLNDAKTAFYNLLVSGAQSYTINGRTFNRMPVKDMRETITWLENRIDAASNVGNGTILVQTGNILGGNVGSGY